MNGRIFSVVGGMFLLTVCSKGNQSSAAPAATVTCGIWVFTASMSPSEISSLNVRGDGLFERVMLA